MVADLLFPILGFAIGLAIIVKASDVAVDLAVDFSRITGMSRLAIGMVILASMTSLPEFAIALSSTFAGTNSIMFGNILGASITDLLFVMGAGALFFSIKISAKDSRKAEQIMLATVMVLLYGFIYGYNIIFGSLCVLAFWFFSQGLLSSKYHGHPSHWKNVPAGLKMLAKLVAAIAVILVASAIVVICTQQISEAAGIINTVMGATLISLATTLPELAVTLSSGRKNEFDLMLGNIFGSCFVNIALIMGIATVIAPVMINAAELAVLLCLFASYVAALFFIRMKKPGRIHGFMLLCLYAAYIIIMSAVA